MRMGQTIRRTRQRKGMTQGQFAKMIGVTQQKLSEWERGMRLRAVMDARRLLAVLNG